MARIYKTAVIGAGVMGAAIAAHLANAGLDVLLLDRIPDTLTDEERQKGLTPEDPAVRNRRARIGVERALAARPAAFFTPDKANRIRTGNLEDDLDQLAHCDWVIEAIIEDPAAKKELFRHLAPHLSTAAILSTNTSGLSVTALAEELPEDLRRRFLGTHFFNPPRYLPLLELIPTAATDSLLVEKLTAFARRKLGKEIVVGKDSPNFVANRIGVYALFNAMQHMQDLGLSFAEVDAICGPVTGRPKSAIFRTADIVGLDTLVKVARHSWQMLPDDEEREIFHIPPFLQEMVEKGLLGDKTGGGFYRRDKDGGIEVYDSGDGNYRLLEKPGFASLLNVRKIADLGQRVAALIREGDSAARFAWRHLRDILLYAVRRVPEIAERFEDVDRAMSAGYNWELGPFAMLDAIGVKEFVRRVDGDGLEVPAILREIAAFYKIEDGRPCVWDPVVGDYRPIPSADGEIRLVPVKAGGGVVEAIAGASLLDLGDGVFCLEFHGKKNTIGPELLDLTRRAVKRAEADGLALVIGNQGELFSAGANLALLGDAMDRRDFAAIDGMIAAFQQATLSLKYARVPVIAAPFQLTLGGGCEYVLHAAAVTAHAETYMGLVEVGVGLIPAAGGTKELALRALTLAESCGIDPLPLLLRAFENIGMAKVSRSADELFDLGYLRPGDQVCMNRSLLLGDAKRQALALAASFRPLLAKDVKAPGPSAAATMKNRLWNLRTGNFISDYDAYIGGLIADVLCGGGVAAGTPITEDDLLQLERENFLKLCGEERTRQRIGHMLATGKPLRN
ncbi:MAG: 3-hydroxyacyl-CoA dehydrogenase NAD-binding domain-containing protein [Syntrophotaleaceae bacterium]